MAFDIMPVKKQYRQQNMKLIFFNRHKLKLMIKRILVFVLFLFLVHTVHAQEKPVVAGMKISKTMKIKKAVYKLDAPEDASKSIILIEGNNIIVDFNNAELKGSNKIINPDEFAGISILIRNSKNVTIKNLKAKGYKVALLARNVEKLTLENCDFSYNYRPHLNSSQEKEDISDWMSYHHNEKDEWLRYGAAIYLRNCNYATIKNCKVTGGQNALMMMECNDGKVYNNDFSFNSGIGLGMYRCSRNEVMYNKINFNVRGYSHGVYNRGQDSAGILVYEQSNNNLFFKNNVTHSGDGFFLWAGQSTMDTGEGGCNDNNIRSNDFSYAPTNGVEVTFSRNSIIDNRMFECDHGIWGGYSYNSTISGNKFRYNRIDIAIEHGQENNITYNVFFKSKEAIKLWARKEQPADWGYANNRDTKSRDYAIAFNTFNICDIVFNLNRTDNLDIFSNTYNENGRLYKRDSTVTNLDTEADQRLESMLSTDTGFVSPKIVRPNDPFKGAGQYTGRKNIMMTEWGPYDFRYPLLWHTNPTDTSAEMQFNLYNLKGQWKIVSMKGVSSPSDVSKQTNFPLQISFQKIPGLQNDIEIVMEYKGPSFIDPFGNSIPANKPYRFSFKKFFQPIKWNVLFFHLDTTYYNPIKTGDLFSPLARMAPFKTDTTDKLDYAWWGGIKEKEIDHKQFITVADGEASIAEGNYELSVTWDDAVRVYVDEKLVINEWNPSLYTFDESPHKKITLKLGGNHHFRVEHLELGGFATLAIKLKRLD